MKKDASVASEIGKGIFFLGEEPRVAPQNGQEGVGRKRRRRERDG